MSDSLSIRPRPRLPAGLARANLLMGAWSGVVILFLYAPVALLVVYSFNRSSLSFVWKGFSLDAYRSLRLHWYVDFLRHLVAQAAHLIGAGGPVAPLAPPAPLIDALNNSLIIACFATAISVPLGAGGAWLLHRYRFPAARAIDALIFIPVVIPEIIMGVSLMIFFLLAGNWLNPALTRLGLGDEPIGLGFGAVILAHVTFCFPFVLIAVRARLAGLDPALEEAALDLGATPRQAFFRVIVPYLRPALVSGALMAFTLSLDELIVTWFVAGPTSQTLPFKVFGEARSGVRPELNAVSTVFVAATAILVASTQSLRRSNRT